MASLEKRLNDLEKRFQPTTPRIIVMLLGVDGRVQSGTPELIGKTCEEVEALYGDGVTVIHVNREGTEPPLD